MPKKTPKTVTLEERLFEAVQSLDFGEIRRLLAAGAQVNQLDPRKKQSPLMEAAQSGNGKLIDLLLTAGADPNQAGQDGGYQGWTPVMYAADSLMRDAHQLIRRLAEAGAQLDLQDEKGRTALAIAVNRGDFCFSQLESLLELGADPAIADKNGYTPMAIAQMRDAPRSVAALQAVNAPRDVLPEAMLMDAADAGDEARARDLIAGGADVNAVLRNGTALSNAVWNGHHGVVMALLEAGADPNIAEPAGKSTPLMRAAYKGQLETVKALLAAGANPDLINTEKKDARAMAKFGRKDKLVPPDVAKAILAALSPA